MTIPVVVLALMTLVRVSHVMLFVFYVLSYFLCCCVPDSSCVKPTYLTQNRGASNSVINKVKQVNWVMSLEEWEKAQTTDMNTCSKCIVQFAPGDQLIRIPCLTDNSATNQP